jgi:hypothetical protein
MSDGGLNTKKPDRVVVANLVREDRETIAEITVRVVERGVTSSEWFGHFEVPQNAPVSTGHYRLSLPSRGDFSTAIFVERFNGNEAFFVGLGAPLPLGSEL